MSKTRRYYKQLTFLEEFNMSENNRTPKISGPRVTVQITEDIINNSVQEDSGHCMIADGIRKVLPLAQYISVDVATIRFTDPEKQLRYTYLTPVSVQRPIVQFDQGQRPEPFRFTLRDPLVTETRPRKKWSKRADKDNEKINLDKPILVKGHNGKITRIGGNTPPRMEGAALGRRRSFGIRALGTPSKIDK